MFSAAFKALGQMPEKEFRSALIQSLLLTLASMIGLIILTYFSIGYLGLEPQGWLESIFEFLGPMVVVALSYFLFPAVASIFIGIYLDAIARAVERKHYPQDEPGQDVGIKDSLLLGIKYAVLLVVILLVTSPLYFIPVFGQVLYYLVNGFILGRSFFDSIALRYTDKEGAFRRRQAYRGRILLSGILIAFLLTVPFVNLLVPLFATAFMVHLYKSMTIPHSQ